MKKIEEMTVLQLIDVMECLSEYCHNTGSCGICPMWDKCKNLADRPSNLNTRYLLEALNKYLKVCEDEKEN